MWRVITKGVVKSFPEWLSLLQQCGNAHINVANSQGYDCYLSCERSPASVPTQILNSMRSSNYIYNPKKDH